MLLQYLTIELCKHILSTWIVDIRSLSRLEVACCSQQYQTFLDKVFHSMSMTLSTTQFLHDNLTHYIPWIYKRKIRIFSLELEIREVSFLYPFSEIFEEVQELKLYHKKKPFTPPHLVKDPEETEKEESEEEEAETENEESFQSFFSLFLHLRKLEIDSSHLSSSTITALLTSFSSIPFMDCVLTSSGITDEHVSQVVQQHGRELLRLSLSHGIEDLSLHSLTAISQHCHFLHSLKLNNEASQYPTEAILKIIEVNPLIEEVKLYCCNVTNEEVVEMVEKAPRLHTLVLEHSNEVTLTVLNLLLDEGRFQQMRKLKIGSRFGYLNLPTTSSFISSLSSSSRVLPGGRDGACYAGYRHQRHLPMPAIFIQNIEEDLRAFLLLHHLHPATLWIDTQNLPDEVIEEVVTMYGPSLKTLIFSSPTMNDSSLLCIVNKCPHLQALHLFPTISFLAKAPRQVYFYRTGVMTASAIYGSQLRELTCQACGDLTDHDLRAIVENCPKLELLDLTKCSKLGEGMLSTVLAKCPRLHAIRLQGTGMEMVVLDLLTSYHNNSSNNRCHQNQQHQLSAVVSKDDHDGDDDKEEEDDDDDDEVELADVRRCMHLLDSALSLRCATWMDIFDY